MFPLDMLSEPVWQRLTWTLLHFLWQGAALAAVVAMLLYVWPLRQAHHRYLINSSALIAMAICPLVTFVVIEIPEPIAIESSLPTAVVGLETAAEDPFSPDPGSEIVVAEIPMGSTVPAVLQSRPLLESPVSATATWKERLLLYVKVMGPYALILWIAGVLVLAMRLSLSWMHLRWLVWGCRAIPTDLAAKVATLGKRLGLRFPPRVCVSEKIREAIVLGLWRPLVLLPLSWLTAMSPEVLEAVIAHELAHVRRFDLWVNLLQRLIETLLFYHPAVWWLSRRVSMEREMCADELAVGATSKRLVYATALEQLGRMRLGQTTPQLGANIGDNKTVLLSRVGNILNLSSSTRRARWWPVGLLALAVPLALWLVSTNIAASADNKSRTEGVAGDTAETLPSENVVDESAEGAAWSKPVDGLRVRLRPTQRQWQSGTTPTLSLDLWNDSDQDKMHLYLGLQKAEREIEVDGQWYRWPEVIPVAQAVLSLKAGQAKDGAVDISLTRSWARIDEPMQGRPVDDALRLNLTPGKHTIRVAFTPDNASRRKKQPRVVSVPVEIEIKPDAKADPVATKQILPILQTLKDDVGKLSREKAPDGITVQLAADKRVWSEGDNPRFKVVLCNEGTRKLTTSLIASLALEVDGKPFAPRAWSSLGVILVNPFGPGAKHTIEFSLGDFGVENLGVGEHTVRAAYLDNHVGEGIVTSLDRYAEMILAFSEAVEIEILPSTTETETQDTAAGDGCPANR